jgi:transposase InsO family protein
MNNITERKDALADSALTSRIKTIIATRPTYGYRRVTAILNAKYAAIDGVRVNHKRVYRVMKDNQLLLSKYGTKPIRVHDGKVITLHSNTRWCSDGFVLSCDNGDKVHVAFSMDTCDREVLRYIASTKGIDGEMIRDLMTESVLYRFGNVHKLPKAIQWLSDNGSCYTARETVRFGRELGFDICTTPPYSPESNGMAEAMVKTFKRDYAWVGDLSSADAVFKQLPGWFDDYNEHAPHKGLKMMSPRQYIRAMC